MQRNSRKRGSVVLDPRSKVWALRLRQEGKQKSIRLGKFKTRREAEDAAETVRLSLKAEPDSTPTVTQLWSGYSRERLDVRGEVRRSYQVWFDRYVLPRWGNLPVTSLKPREVEIWLKSLEHLQPKSKVHIRSRLSAIWDYAAWCGIVPSEGQNPMRLVQIRGAASRNKPISLTVQQFQAMLTALSDPVIKIMTILGVCLGLRASEVRGLKWRDVDWQNLELLIVRGIHGRTVEFTKTKESSRGLPLDDSLLLVLKDWRLRTQFDTDDDWIVASPAKLGKLPISYPWFWKQLREAAIRAGVGPIGTHTLRHTFRAWLDSVGTPIAVQQNLMRHADIKTTMNVYGSIVDSRMKEAQSKVVRLLLQDEERFVV